MSKSTARRSSPPLSPNVARGFADQESVSNSVKCKSTQPEISVMHASGPNKAPVNVSVQMVAPYATTPWLHIFHDRWKSILALFIVTFLILLWRLAPEAPRFRATATIFVSNSFTSLTREAGGGMRASSASSPIRSVNTHISILTNSASIKKAIGSLPITASEAGWDSQSEASAAVKARSPDGQNLIALSVTANNAKAATDLINSLLRVYSEQLAALARYDSERSLQVVLQQLNENRAVLSRLRTTMRPLPKLGSGATDQVYSTGKGQDHDAVADAEEAQVALEAYVKFLRKQQTLKGVPSYTVMSLTSEEDPSSRNWPRAIITSIVCALVILMLFTVWLQQLNRDTEETAL